MTVPPTPLPGAATLAELRPDDAAFEPAIDLLADGRVLATLFYDDKPECAYVHVEVENEAGEPELRPGAAAGLDEDEVGWCLQFTDEPRQVHVICRMGLAWEQHALAAAWVLLAARVQERGGAPWEPEPDFRLWGPIEDTEEEDPDGELSPP